MKNLIRTFLVAAMYLLSGTVIAQDKTAEMSISFGKEDDKNVCKVALVSEGKPAAEIAVKLYVKSLFANVQIG